MVLIAKSMVGAELLLLALTYLIFPLIVILLLRLFGAWALRITDLINIQKEILQELKTLNSKD